MNKIKRISYFFRVLFQIAFIIIPILLILFWLQAPKPLGFPRYGITISFIHSPYSTWAILHVLSTQEKFYGFLISLLSTGTTEIVLYFLIKLFCLYEKAEIFTIKSVNYIRNIAYILLIGQILLPIQEGLMSMTLTRNNPHGYKVAAISFSGSNIGVILMALFMLLISWIMAEGCRLREEQELTI